MRVKYASPDYDPVDKVTMNKCHMIDGVNVEVRKAIPKDILVASVRGSSRGGFSSRGGYGGGRGRGGQDGGGCGGRGCGGKVDVA